MAKPLWGIEAELARKEQKLIEMFQNSADVDDDTIELMADSLDEKYPTIFDRVSFIEKCKQKPDIEDENDFYFAHL